MKSYVQFKEGILKDKKLRRACDALGLEFEVVASLIKHPPAFSLWKMARLQRDTVL